MPAFMKLGKIKGEASDDKHPAWIRLESVSSSIFRTIPEGSKDQGRTKGETVLGDITVVRQLDKSSTKIQEACAKGEFFDEAEIHLCTTVKNKQEPYLTYKLKDVVLSSYGFHGQAAGDPLPTEELTLAYTEADWNYIKVNPKTGMPDGNVPGGYNPGKGKSSK